MTEQLQPLAKSATFFEVLGLPRAMALQGSAIEKAFRETSKRVHPDKFAGADPSQRKIALDYTTFVNDAYRTLKDPQRRAEYLMSLDGVRIGDESSTTRDPELLMEMLELQETLESTQDPAELKAMRIKTQLRKMSLLELLTLFFDQQQGTKEKAVSRLQELRYLERLLERIDARLEAQEN